jgi:heme A synthase
MNRAVATAAHLTNTFVLLACLSMVCWCTFGRRLPRLGRDETTLMLVIGAIGTLVLGITGTFAALGDTLFPSSSIIASMQQDFAPTANYLIRLRPLHPMVALVVSLYLGGTASVLSRRRPSGDTRMFRKLMMYLFAVQLAFGFLNLMLHAPVWMQLVHLFLADILWITLILFGAAALTAEPRVVPAGVPQPA